eukprot:32854-Eustigmatos_ZCMA.PRE.1
MEGMARGRTGWVDELLRIVRGPTGVLQRVGESRHMHVALLRSFKSRYCWTRCWHRLGVAEHLRNFTVCGVRVLSVATD